MSRTNYCITLSLWVRLKILYVDSVLSVSDSECVLRTLKERRKKEMRENQIHETYLPNPLESLDFI